MVKQEALFAAGVAVAILAAIYLLKKKVDAAGGMGNVVAGAVSGTIEAGTTGIVYGVADSIGIPRTDKTQCQKDLDNGDMWAASFSCPAGTFIGGVWDAAKGKVGL